MVSHFWMDKETDYMLSFELKYLKIYGWPEKEWQGKLTKHDFRKVHENPTLVYLVVPMDIMN